MAAGLQDLHLGHPDGPQVVCGPLRRPAHVILVPGQSAHAWDAQEVQKLLYVSLPVATQTRGHEGTCFAP